MSIASEISRLQTAKADIKTAIEAKGVTVPSNAKLDTYDTYVSQISGGGGTNYLAQYARKGLTGAITSAQLGTNIGWNMPRYFLDNQYDITSVDLTGTNTAEITNGFCNNCWSLASITIPSTVSKIGSDFCMNNSANGVLTSITIPSSVTEIGSNFVYNQKNLTSITLPSSVTSIGNYFAVGTKITSFTMPSTVTSIGNYCFKDCFYLTQFIYNAPTATLPQWMCSDSVALELVDLNSSVSSLAKYDFSNDSANTNLLEVVLRKTDGIVTLPNAIGSGSAAFRNRQNIKLYVPSALIASYQANSNWAAGITAGFLTIVALEGSQYE